MPQVVDITSAAGTPLPVASPTTTPSRPPRGGGSRRSLLPPPWLAGSKERSASPLGWAPPQAARLPGCASPPVAPAQRALAHVSLALDAAPAFLGQPFPRPNTRRSCPL